MFVKTVAVAIYFVHTKLRWLSWVPVRLLDNIWTVDTVEIIVYDW